MSSAPEPFEFDSIPAPTTFSRNGESTYFDQCRKMLVSANPEEKVRQRFISYLVEEIGVPSQNLATEVPISEFTKRKHGRADIVGFSITEGGIVPLFVVECKARNVSLADQDFNQLLRYDNSIDCEAGVLVLTNGHQTHWYHRTNEGEVELLEGPVTFRQMAKQTEFEYAEPTPSPSRPHPNDQAGIKQFLRAGLIGSETPEEHYKFIVNLIGLLYLEPSSPDYRNAFKNFDFIETGIRRGRYGNMSGGTWAGPYRYFLIQDDQGEHQLVSLAIMAEQTGRTKLLVAIDNFEKSHHSLQHDLDRLSRRQNGAFELYHDGRLTVGSQGAAKRSDVIDFVEGRAPELLKDEEIILGSIPTTDLYTWDRAQPLIERSIRYALVRDDYRSEV